MTATKEAVLAQALTLSESDRQEIIDRLSQTLADADPVAAAWDAEIDRRLDDAAAGRTTFLPWAEARRRIVGDADVPHG